MDEKEKLDLVNQIIREMGVSIELAQMAANRKCKELECAFRFIDFFKTFSVINFVSRVEIVKGLVLLKIQTNNKAEIIDFATGVNFGYEIVLRDAKPDQYFLIERQQNLSGGDVVVRVCLNFEEVAK